MHYITAVKLSSGGTKPEHIAEGKWLNATTGVSGVSNTPTLVKFIDEGNTIRVGGPKGPSTVRVVRPSNGAPYIRTTPDSTPNDNLLMLPRY